MTIRHARHLDAPGFDVPGTVVNSAGGASFALDHWARLERFLILGSEKGSYYASERRLTIENAVCVQACLNADGVRAVDVIVAVSQDGRAPKNDPAIFALALATTSADLATRNAAYAALPRVCRTGTHLFQFADAANALRGWGRGLRRAIGRWYRDQPLDALALQAVKYKNRNGWSHRDLLRLSHPQLDADDTGRRAAFDWICGRQAAAGHVPGMLMAHDRLHGTREVGDVIEQIRTHGVPREAVPTEWLDNRSVWDALLVDMPMMAMIRNLNRMTVAGLLTPGAAAATYVQERLGNAAELASARVHPMSLLLAQATYASGRGMLGRLEWQPVRQIVDALDRAFYLAFETVVPSNKSILLAIDVSGSMDMSRVAGSWLTARQAAAAMALVTVATEPQTQCVAFTYAGSHLSNNGKVYGVNTGLHPLPLSPTQRLDDVVQQMKQFAFGGTDCALPMLYALEHGLRVDAFVVYTDSETWAGHVHPVEALRRYREATGIAARLVVVGMVSNGFTIADPDDPGMMDVVGFDTATPALLSDFIAGRI
jgi:60 kDa SS-A/Ro ribonucleoprotein